MMLDADFVYLECGAAFEVEPDFDLDITAVDTTLVGDDDVQPFYPKEMKHDGGFDMSKLFFCYCIQINFLYIAIILCRIEECS